MEGDSGCCCNSHLQARYVMFQDMRFPTFLSNAIFSQAEQNTVNLSGVTENVLLSSFLNDLSSNDVLILGWLHVLRTTFVQITHVYSYVSFII